MGTREIRANMAQLDGEYVRIKQHSWKPLGFTMGFITGLVLALIMDTDWSTGWMLALIFSIIGSAVSPGKVIWEIPEVDLVEIQHFPEEDAVMVTIDDERTKRKQAVTLH